MILTTSVPEANLDTIQYLLELAFGKAKQSVEIEHKDRSTSLELKTTDAVEASRIYSQIMSSD